MGDLNPGLTFNNIQFEALYAILTIIRHHKEDTQQHTLEFNSLNFTWDENSVTISVDQP